MARLAINAGIDQLTPILSIYPGMSLHPFRTDDQRSSINKPSQVSNLFSQRLVFYSYWLVEMIRMFRDRCAVSVQQDRVAIYNMTAAIEARKRTSYRHELCQRRVFQLYAEQICPEDAGASVDEHARPA